MERAYIGLLIFAGVGAGILWATMRTWWRDVTALKARTRLARRGAWRATFEFAVLGFGLAVFVAYLIGRYRAG